METNVLQHIMRLCRCVLPAILLAASAVMSAQELQITDALRTMEPMTVPMQRLDFNNQICAMVKVELPVAGVQFEGNVVGEPLFKTTEYWVYLTPGTKMLKIKAPGHYSLMADFPALGLGPLESKSIYYLTIKGLASAPTQQVVTANYAVLSVAPPTATVKIDGQTQTVEDGSVIALLKLGQHTWQAEAAGYASDSGTFQITPTDKTSVNIQLRSQKATLTVSTVADAAVFVNGKQHDSGNQTLELLPGMYNIELRRQGYRTYTQTVELQASQSAQVSCTEFTPLYGMLNVNYRPVGATITLNGRQVGTTPANLSNVNVGTYNLAISAPGYTSHTQQVTITEENPVTLSGSLQKQTVAVAPTATTTSSSVSSDQYSTTPINLALCAELNGQIVYVTQMQWNAMLPIQQAACKKKGVCVIGDYDGKTYRFLLELNDSGKGMTWDEAMSRYGDSLPTREQAEVMSKNRKPINEAINAFGGDKDPEWGYWTRTEYESSRAWFVYMSYGMVHYYSKTNSYRVRAVATVPDKNGNVSQTVVSSPAGQYSTTPINLALCVELNGRTVYITQAQWEKMSATEQGACKNKWLCVIGDYDSKNYRFLLALNHRVGMTWDEAMSRYGDSLPTKEQGEVMEKNYKAINKAIIAFGGDKDPVWSYWTRTERDSSNAWYVGMHGNGSHYSTKNYVGRVRAVAPVQPSSAM